MHRAEVRDLTDSEALFRLMAELWTDRESFLIVKYNALPACAELSLDLDVPKRLRDYFPTRSAEGCVVDELAACSQPWCLHPYPDAYTAAVRPGHLCCTRFSAQLLARLPKAVEESVEEALDDLPGQRYEERGRRHYLRVPDRLSARLRRYGVTEHIHEPGFAHFVPLEGANKLKRQALRAKGQSISGLRRAQLVDHLSRQR